MTYLLFVLRGLRKNPAFTSVALASLALGIGANTAIFSVMDAVHLRSLAVRNPGELVLLGDGVGVGITSGIQDSARLFSIDFARRLKQHTGTFSQVAWVNSLRADLHVRFAAASEFEAANIRLVSGGYFATLGVGAAAGQVLGESDDAPTATQAIAVMSDAMWARRFNRDPGVIGRTMTLNGMAFTIKGVAATGFKGTDADESTDFWIPLSLTNQVLSYIDRPEDPNSAFLLVFGRLKAGTTITEAQTNTLFLYQQWLPKMPGATPENIAKSRMEMTPFGHGISRLKRRYTDPLWILAGIAGMVLLIACGNLANLLLARGNGRRREMAVRLALGAGRARLTGELLVESAMLSLAGGALGILVAWWGSQYLLSMVADPDSPMAVDTTPNGHVLAFAVVTSLLTGVLFGIAPALRATRVDPGPALKEGKGSAAQATRGWLSKGLVVGQVTLALLLTAGAGLLLRTLANLEAANPGFQAQHVYVVQMDTDSASLKGLPFAEMCKRIQQRVAETPGVVGASFSSSHFGGGRMVLGVLPEGAGKDVKAILMDGGFVTGSYFDTVGMSMLAGRTFAATDASKSEAVAVVNETLAKKLFPDGIATGQRLSTGGPKPDFYRIVGIVRDARITNLREKQRGMFYLNLTQSGNYGAFADLFVRVAGDARPVMEKMRGIVRAEDANFAIARVDTLGELVDRTLSSERLMARLGGFFAALALSLSAIGLYGVLAYGVSQRTNEIGIRMALGAQPAAVHGMILRESLVLVAIGICVGVPAALIMGRLIESQLYGLGQRDPLTIMGASLVMLVVALGASLAPARRAARMDPLVALRNE